MMVDQSTGREGVGGRDEQDEEGGEGEAAAAAAVAADRVGEGELDGCAE